MALIEGEKPGTWIDLKNGGLLEERPATETTRTTHGGRMLWEQTRSAEDRDGGTHVFHQQRYIPGISGAASGLKISRNGFQMRGSSIGFHSDGTGHLFGIAGTRFEDVKVVIKPAILTARSALENAVTGARAQRGDVAYLENLDEAFVKRLLGQAELLLASTGDGRTFGYLWTLKVATTRGSTLNVEMDAATGEVLSVFDGRANSTCEPSSSTEVSVNGISQLGGTITGLPATEAPDLDNPWSEFTREAHRAVSGLGVPEIIVYLGEDSDQCSATGGQNYRVFPLKLSGGEVWYDDWNVGGRSVQGRSATDAMLHTIQTMNFLKWHGWNSYDGNGGPAKIAVDSFCGGDEDQAKFDTDGDAVDFPRDGIGICRLSPSSPYEHQLSASLEVVAHEWAHGVLTHSIGLSSDENGSLHEGFCDVVGYAVEISNGGSGIWQYGEDSYESAGWRDRRVDQDLATGIPARFHSFHRCDAESMRTPWIEPEAHLSGNKLPAAFRMMVLGVGNPGIGGCDVVDYCSYESGVPFDLCQQSLQAVPEILGFEHAFDYLFDLFVKYAPSSVDWVDLQSLAILVGRNGVVSKKGGGNLIEIGTVFDPPCIEYQDLIGLESARDALLAIGYPPSVPVRPCD